MKVRFAHLCDYAMVSREGKLSVLGIFTRITAAEIPAVHPAAYLAFEIDLEETDPDEFSVSIEVVSPDDEATLLRVDGVARLQKEAVPLRDTGHILALRQLVLPGYGTYRIRISAAGEVVHELPFEVGRTRQPKPEAPAVPT